MRRVELARRLAVLAPGLDELAVLGELHDAVVGVAAVAVGDIDVAVGRDRDVARPIERVLAVAGHAGLAERHQDLAVRAELDDDSALAVLAALVGHPDVALAVDAEAMREVEHAAAEALHEFAGRIELHDRRDSRLSAVVRAAAVEDPDALAVAIDLDADRRAPSCGRPEASPSSPPSGTDWARSWDRLLARTARSPEIATTATIANTKCASHSIAELMTFLLDVLVDPIGSDLEVGERGAYFFTKRLRFILPV